MILGQGYFIPLTGLKFLTHPWMPQNGLCTDKNLETYQVIRRTLGTPFGPCRLREKMTT